VLLEQFYNQVRFSEPSDAADAFLRFDALLASSDRLTPEDPIFEGLHARRLAYLAECLLPFHPQRARGYLARAMELVQEGTVETFLWAILRRIEITVTYSNRPVFAARKFAGLLAEVPGIFNEYELRLDFTRYLFESEAPPDLVLEQIDWLGANSAEALGDAESLYLMSLVGGPSRRLPPKEWGQYSNQVRPMRIRFAPLEERRAFVQEWAALKSSNRTGTLVFDRLHGQTRDEARTAVQLEWLLGEEGDDKEGPSAPGDAS
jgi:hypothetical protein